MRVLLVVHGYPPAAIGGTEVYAEAHATQLAQAGDDVLVMARESDPSAPEHQLRHERRDGVALAWINNTFASVRSFPESYDHPAITARAMDAVDAFAPDVAHVHHLTCLSTSLLAELDRRRIPVVMTLHDYWPICHRGQLLDTSFHVCEGPEPDGCASCIGSSALPSAAFTGKRMLNGLTRALPDRLASVATAAARRAAETVTTSSSSRDASVARMHHMREMLSHVAQFIAPSRHIRDRFVRFGLDPARIVIREYGVSEFPRHLGTTAPRNHTPAPDPSTPAPQHQNAARPLVAGFLGSLIVSKAPHALIAAASRLPAGSIRVEIAGAAAAYHGDTSYDRAVASALAGSSCVKMHGPLAPSDVPGFLRGLDVLVVPSVWPENSPFVIREAFCAGVPVVASRIGGIPETVEDGRNGLLFTAGDTSDLARVLGRLIDDPTLLPELRGNLPRIPTIAEDVAGLRDIYAQLTTVRSRPSARLAAIVLHYGTPDDTCLAVRSLLLSARPPDDIFVVDNDPVPSLNLPVSLRGSVTTIRNGRNLGFAGGVNAGIREALTHGADLVLLLNSDAVIGRETIGTLERALRRSPGAGIAAPVLLDRRRPDRVAALGMSFHRGTGRMRVAGVGTDAEHIGAPATRRVDAVSGCVMLITRDTFDRAGLFGEDYFFGFEDIDFCVRAADAGLHAIVVTGATALHEGGKSIGADSPQRFYFGARNQLLAARRANRNTDGLASAARSAYIIGLNAAHACRASGGTLPSRLAAVARGSWDYVSRRFGEGRQADPKGR